MAAKDTILATRAEGTGSGAVSAPIYLGDSMQLRYNTGDMFAEHSIELETRETLPGQSSQVIFSIPKELAHQQSDIDRPHLRNGNHHRQGLDTQHIADAYEMSDECRQSMRTVAAQMNSCTLQPEPHLGLLHPQHDPSSGNRRREGGPHNRQPALAALRPERGHHSD